MKSNTIMWGAIILLTILCGVLTFLYVRQSSSHDRENYQIALAAKDSLLKYNNEKISLLHEVIGMKDSSIVLLHERISFTDKILAANKISQTNLKKSYEKIPLITNNLSNDELRREIANYR